MLTSLVVDLEKKIQHTGGDYNLKISRTMVNNEMYTIVDIFNEIIHTYVCHRAHHTGERGVTIEYQTYLTTG